MYAGKPFISGLVMKRKNTNSKASSTAKARGKSPGASRSRSQDAQVRFHETRRNLDITQYASYRDYLRDLYAGVKTSRKSYSFAKFSADLGLSETNVIWLVLNHRRDLSAASARKIAQTLQFNKDEKYYFLTLVDHNNTRRPDQRDALMRELVTRKGNLLQTPQENEALEYFSEWYHPVIRELVSLEDFSADADWVNQKLFLKLTPRQIEDSLKLLVNLGLIRFDETQKRYAPTGEQIFPDRKTGKLAAIRYHQKACDIARESVASVPARRRDLNVLTLSISDEAAMEVSKILYEACEKIMTLEQNVQNKDQIYQVNVQLFALTRS